MRLAAALVVLWLPAPYALAQVDVDAGRRSYEICAGCHGFLGEGSALVHAPRLAGLESWYLDRQLRNFARGIRGGAEGDEHGAHMAPMALAVTSDRAREDLLAYIDTLPARSAAPRARAAGAAATAIPAGNFERGRGLYATCAACHGQNAEGNEAISSPGLAILDDWYVVEQLRLFADGLRGTHPDDTYGAQMRAFAATFADEQSRQDIAAYLVTLDSD